MPEHHRRLLDLVSRSGALLGSIRPEDVLPNLLALAADFIRADGYAVWRLSAGGTWRVEAHAGVSDGYASGAVAAYSQAGAVAMLRDVRAVEDVRADAALQERREAHEREGIHSMLIVPLPGGEVPSATLVFYYRARHAFSQEERETAQALGSLAGAALQTSDRYAELQRREQQAVFLARAGTTLAGSLDYLETLGAVARLAVPDIADWCAVDVVNADGVTERVAVAHVDPARVQYALEFARKYPTPPDAPTGLPAVIRTGRPEILEQLTEAMLLNANLAPEHLADVRRLQITSYMIVPLRTRRGNVGAITFVWAESGRRYTEADLRFAETVADRAAVAIENAWAYEEARTASQLKDQFLATLSHELRTPLNAIVGYARMLRDDALAEERRGIALDVIDRNAGALTQIVEDILDVSRIMSGKLRLLRRRVRAAALADHAASSIVPAAESKGIRLETVATDDPEIDVDPDRLQQVLWNLLANAVKFTPQGGTIRFSVSRRGGSAEFRVDDTGRGIDAAFLPHVFDAFRQADSGASREQGGLGLGLSIARQIVELHGGTIAVRSPGAGQGATFIVTLPALPA